MAPDVLGNEGQESEGQGEGEEEEAEEPEVDDETTAEWVEGEEVEEGLEGALTAPDASDTSPSKVIRSSFSFLSQIVESSTYFLPKSSNCSFLIMVN